MKINLNQAIKNFDGTPAMKGDKSFTFREVFVDAVLVEPKEGGNVEKMSRWTLAKKIRSAKEEVELTVEEAAKLKGLVTESFPILVAGQIADTIDGVKEE